MLFCLAAGVLGSIAAVQWAPVGPRLWGWPFVPSLLGGLVLALIVALIRRQAPTAP